MLGGSCSPCCSNECACADTCVYCATVDDGVTTYNSCSSPMFNGGPPIRVSECGGLLTQPAHSPSCTGTRVLIGDMSTFLSDPPPPFQPLEQGFCLGQSIPLGAPGFYYAKIESGGDPGVSSVSTRLQAVAAISCSNELAQIVLRLSYFYQVTKSTLSTVDGVLQQKQQGTTYYYRTQANYDFSLFPSCSGATSKCVAGAGGNFALGNLDAVLSIDQLSYSINNGSFTGSTTTGEQSDPKKTEYCRVNFLNSGQFVNCSDFLGVSDGLFSPPTFSFSLFQDADQYPCNPLP